MKEFYSTFSGLLTSYMSNVAYQLIPVGSYVIGCMIKEKAVVDCHMSIDRLEDHERGDGTLVQQLKTKMDSLFEDLEKFDRPGTICEFCSDNNSALLIKDGSSNAVIRVFVSSSKMFQEDQQISKVSAGIFHTNWLVETYNQSPNAWQTVKLFRMVRVWK